MNRSSPCCLPNSARHFSPTSTAISLMDRSPKRHYTARPAIIGVTAVMAMAARYFGRDVTLERVCELAGSGPLGYTLPWELALAARIATLRRAILLGQLRQAGIRVVDWDVRLDLPVLVEQALGRQAGPPQH